MEIDEYMFKLKICVLGDKSVGKSTFLQCIENSFGELVSSEETDELTLKVRNYKIQILKFPSLDRCLHGRLDPLQNPVLGAPRIDEGSGLHV